MGFTEFYKFGRLLMDVKPRHKCNKNYTVLGRVPRSYADFVNLTLTKEVTLLKWKTWSTTVLQVASSFLEWKMSLCPGLNSRRHDNRSFGRVGHSIGCVRFPASEHFSICQKLHLMPLTQSRYVRLTSSPIFSLSLAHCATLSDRGNRVSVGVEHHTRWWW